MKALNQQAGCAWWLKVRVRCRAAQQYGQNLGSQEYQNAFNRYQAERHAQLNPLQSRAGVGQTSAQSIGGAGQQHGTNVGKYWHGALVLHKVMRCSPGAQARGSAWQGFGQSFGNVLGQLNQSSRPDSQGYYNLPGSFGYSGQ